MRRQLFPPPPAEVRLPRPPAPAPDPQNFMLWAVPCDAGSWAAHQWLYEQAFARAQAVVRPSILERDLLGVWN